MLHVSAVHCIPIPYPFSQELQMVLPHKVFTCLGSFIGFGYLNELHDNL